MSSPHEISIKGRTKSIPIFQVNNTAIVVRGRFIRTAEIFDELWLESGQLPNPEELLAELRQKESRPDLFTFTQRIPEVTPKYNYHMQWENFAVTRTVSYEEWLGKMISGDARKKIKKSAKRGLVTEAIPFDDELVRGIKSIYDESPFRQGKRFWHYGKDLETIRRENGTYLDRSTFIGTFFEGALVGFVKLIWLGNVASTMQVISKMQHFDKAPNNALIAKTVSTCALNGVEYLTYGAYAYKYKGDASSLTDFKRANGFLRMDVPRYHVPLTIKGQLALRLDPGRILDMRIPSNVIKRLIELRARIYKRHETR
jgi:hypothetical protein